MAGSLEENIRMNEVLGAMIQRYAVRVARDGGLGKAALRLAVDGDTRGVDAAEVEALHLWAFMLRVPVEKLADAIISRAENLTPEDL